MTNQAKLSIVAIILIGTIVLVFLFSGKTGKDATMPQAQKEYYNNWDQRFDNFDKNPLGTYLFNRILQTHIDTNNFYEVDDWNQLDSIHLDSLAIPSYIFVGHSFGITEDETHDVLMKVAEGSTVFLSSNLISNNVLDSLFYFTEYSFVYDEKIQLQFNNKELSLYNVYQMDTLATNWNVITHFGGKYENKSISFIDEYTNCISVKIGKGKLYIHSTPSLFYNFQVQTNNGFEYAEFIANLLPENQDIYSLEIGRLTDNYGKFDEFDLDEEFNGTQDRSFLQFIFENRTLLFAFILAIITTFLFLIFRAKRLHPVVPYIPKKKDVTLAFAETITSIYLSRKNPYGLLAIQKKNFYVTIKKHFFLDLGKKDREKSIHRLAEKADIPQAEIETILELLETTRTSSVDDAYLIRVSKIIHDFYRKTKVISERTIEKIGFRTITIRRSFILPALLILSGMFFFLYGTYFLVIAMGVGIALWPISFVLIGLGIIRMKNPVMKIEKDGYAFYSIFGKMKKFTNDELLKAELLSNGYIFVFKNGKKIRINTFEVSGFDRKQLQNYISKLNELEL